MFVFLTRSVVDQHQHSDKFAESHGCGWSSGSAGCRGAAAHLYAAERKFLSALSAFLSLTQCGNVHLLKCTFKVPALCLSISAL